MRKSVLACVFACGMVMLACSRQPRPNGVSQAAPKAGMVARPDASTMPQPAPASPALSVPASVQPAAQTVSEVVVSDHAEGPFHVGGQDFTFVKHVQSIEGKTSADDSTVE